MMCPGQRPGHIISGGGGNRTRVRRRQDRASPGAACCGLSQPRRSHRRVAEPGSVTVHVATIPVTGTMAIGLLVDASYRAEGTPGLTDLSLASGGESEIRLCRFGSYLPATMVREITSPPRPASPESTSNVETCHPLVELRRQVYRSAGHRADRRRRESAGPHPRLPAGPQPSPCPGRAPGDGARSGRGPSGTAVGNKDPTDQTCSQRHEPTE
jgi:hypothetical protein